MKVIEEKIIKTLRNFEQALKDGETVKHYTVLSRSDYYGKGQPRDIILFEDRPDKCIEYKLFNTVLYSYNHRTGQHSVLCSTYSQTTVSRVKALLSMDPAVTAVHIKNKVYYIEKKYSYAETIKAGETYIW